MKGEKAVLHGAMSASESAAYWVTAAGPGRRTPRQSQQSRNENKFPQQEDGYGLVIFAFKFFIKQFLCDKVYMTQFIILYSFRSIVQLM